MRKLIAALAIGGLTVTGTVAAIAAGEREAVLRELQTIADSLDAGRTGMSWGSVEAKGWLFKTDIVVENIAVASTTGDLVLKIGSLELSDVDVADDGGLTAAGLRVSGIRADLVSQRFGLWFHALQEATGHVTVAEIAAEAPDLQSIIPFLRGERPAFGGAGPAAHIFRSKAFELHQLAWDGEISPRRPPGKTQSVWGANTRLSVETVRGKDITQTGFAEISVERIAQQITGRMGEQSFETERVRVENVDFSRALAEFAEKGDDADMLTLLFGVRIGEAEAVNTSIKSDWMIVKSQRDWVRNVAGEDRGHGRYEGEYERVVFTPSDTTPFVGIFYKQFGKDGSIVATAQGSIDYDLEQRSVEFDSSTTYEQLFRLEGGAGVRNIPTMPVRNPVLGLIPPGERQKQSADRRLHHDGPPVLERWHGAIADLGLRTIVFAIVGSFSNPPKSADQIRLEMVAMVQMGAANVDRIAEPLTARAVDAVVAFVRDGGTLSAHTDVPQTMTKEKVPSSINAIDRLQIIVEHTPPR